MKNILFTLTLLFLALAGVTAQTISFTPTSLEVIAPSAKTRAFYDLDNVYITYKAGAVLVMENSTGSIVFSGDTSEISVTGATHWGAKATKLARWYQSAGTTTGYRYFLPRKGVNFVYNGTTTFVKVVASTNKRLLYEADLDSIHISGVSGDSNKLTYLRNQQFLDSRRDAYNLDNLVTIAAGAAAGSSPTVSIAGNAVSGVITVVTGASGATTGTLCTVTLPVTYPNAIDPIVVPNDANSVLHGVRWFADSASASTFIITIPATALGSATTYKFRYQVNGR